MVDTNLFFKNQKGGGKMKERGLHLKITLSLVIATGIMFSGVFFPQGICFAQKVWQMKYDFYNVERCEPAVIDRWALDEVAKRSNGQIKVRYFWMGALHKTGEHWAAVRDGLSEISFINFGYYQPQTPISRGVEWSWKKGASDPDVHMKMMNRLYEEFPDWQKEYEKENLHVLWFTNWWPAFFNFKKPYISVESIKGLRIRAYGVASDALKAIGTIPMPIAAPEIYSSLERGVVDGLLMVPVGFSLATHMETVVPYIVDGGYGVCGPSAVVMNKKLWDSLPQDLKKIFLDVKKELINRKWTEVLQEFENSCTDQMVKKGAKFSKWDDAEIEKANKLVQPMEVERWIQEMEKLGFKDAKKFQKRAEDLLKESGPTTFVPPHIYYKQRYGSK